jgi:hypothetical protein
MQSPTASEHRQVRPGWTGLSVGALRVSTPLFLVSLVLFILAVPFLTGYPYGDIVESVLLTLILASGVFAIGASRGTLIFAAALVVPGLIAKWINHFSPEAMPPGIHLAIGVVFLAFVSVHLLRFLLRAPRVDTQVLQTGIATYLVFGLLWSLAYLLVARLLPGAFSMSGEPGPGQVMDSFTALYFSFVTLSTMGYGDIVPVARAARMLAILEATTGVLYMSVLIARLVGLYSTVTPLDPMPDPNGTATQPSPGAGVP